MLWRHRESKIVWKVIVDTKCLENNKYVSEEFICQTSSLERNENKTPWNIKWEQSSQTSLKYLRKIYSSKYTH